MSTIGERIRSIRKLHKLNQTEFASIIKVSQGTLSELEQDKYKPSLDIVMALYDQFKTDLYWLVYGFDQVSDVSISKGLGDSEARLISEYRNLKPSDQDEIRDFIKLKIHRYHSK
ncbi:helix-turn-helix domain-containing protein [Paenibacillus xylanilyticus]|uniref:Helix-turn-helix transcriptional regulator n=1 Tax=Paenibacillus xylanilyticus TaxID=248903 RepID=A0A7Y6BST4_9BACL|nr:helix-turn-helix transcriptional regulator [Paenibacillus xylanilyticus]NUU74325.1 helix-turn-helix transcriptional regulator [Paenibacillus xylanilyticus]